MIGRPENSNNGIFRRLSGPIELRKKLPLLLITFLITVSLFFLTACDLTEERFYEVRELDYAEEQSDNVTIYEIIGEHTDREIRAERVERYYEEKKIEAYMVKIIDFNPDSTVGMTLDADRLTIDEPQNIFTARSNVVIRHANAVLYTELMIWDQNSDEIYAPEEVTVVRGENVLRGIELITDIGFDSLELSRVTAEGKLDDEDFADLDW